MRGLLVVAALTLLQACGASNAPGAPGGGTGGPDAGGPGAALLTVSPQSQRLVAGSAAVSITATLTGDSGPITWALSGPGTLGANTGTATSYAPPATVQAETTATVTASAGPGLTAAVTVTIVPASAMEVTGRVVGTAGSGLQGLTVSIGDSTAVTGADGRFSIPGVNPPYDLTVVLSGATLYAGRYEGLTRHDPTLVFLYLVNSGEPNTATVSGTVSGGDPVGTAGEFTAAVFTFSAGVFDLDAIGITERNNPFTLPLSWFGPESTLGNLHVLQWKSPRPGTPPTEYTGYGDRSAIAVTRGMSLEGANVTMTVPTTGSIAGTIVPPAGYTVESRFLGLELDGLTAVPLGHVDTDATDFQFAVPGGIPATASVTVSAQRVGAGTTSRRLSRLLPGQVGISLELPTPALPTSPADGTTGVSGTTDFTWTPFQNGVHFVLFDGGTTLPNFYVVTAGTTARIPIAPALGVGLPRGASYTWFVAGFGPFASVDAFTGGVHLFPPLGETVQSVSETQGFVTE